jgi:2-polyprenyl-3-methyl-5-hydroxy-6-metoxy-1,4-benzoquinol methylase
MGCCYICRGNRQITICEIPTGSIVRCGDCDTVYRSSVVTGSDYVELYQNQATMETPFYIANKLASDPHVEPMPTFARGLAGLNQLSKPGRLLDIGCSYGAFMLMAQNSGWNTVGVELSTGPAKFAREERHLDVFTGTVEQAAYPSGHFDAVTLWDVIEHFDDPVTTIKEINRIMAPGAILLVFTINQESLLNTIGHAMYRLSLKRWKRIMALFYDIHHNFFFSPRTISSFLRRGGLDVVDIKFGAANVRRWRTVPINPVMIAGSDAIDFVSGLINKRYRMLVYAQKPIAEPSACKDDSIHFERAL